MPLILAPMLSYLFTPMVIPVTATIAAGKRRKRSTSSNGRDVSLDEKLSSTAPALALDHRPDATAESNFFPGLRHDATSSRLVPSNTWTSLPAKKQVFPNAHWSLVSHNPQKTQILNQVHNPYHIYETVRKQHQDYHRRNNHHHENSVGQKQRWTRQRRSRQLRNTSDKQQKHL